MDRPSHKEINRKIKQAREEMKEERMDCPSGHGKMVIRQTTEKIDFRGVSIKFPVEQYICMVCGTKAGTAEQTDTIQKTIANVYRRAVNLLTGEEIVEKRKRLSLTQEGLAKRMNVGIASIKRWEGGTIQSKSMDHALRIALGGQSVGDSCTGNRTFSIPRIKLVVKEFESVLGKHILKKNDKMLFAAKYLWYADMVAHRETGESMTGATYAKLPYGPQLNNYKDLIEDIMKANQSEAEPLSPEEKRIITRIALRFPEERMAYDSAHKEKIWKKQPNGAIIPYTDSAELTGV
jgi:putative zinc finger/helix-turn-helix YgiT family protein